MKKIKLSEENLIAICAISFLLLLFGIPIGTVAIQDSKTYDSMIVAVEQKNWTEAKTKLESLSQNKLKSSNDYAKLIYYNYHLNLGETLFKEKKYHNALSKYRSAFSYDSSNKNLESKIKELEATCKKLDEIERKRAEQERLKAEQERKRAEQEEKLKTQRMLNNVVILSQYFGYTKYGEYGVVGKIKNNNSFPVQVRADIDLKDYNGNVIDATYTYDRIAPYSIWNFEAPIFGNVAPHHSYMHLTIEQLD